MHALILLSELNDIFERLLIPGQIFFFQKVCHLQQPKIYTIIVEGSFLKRQVTIM